MPAIYETKVYDLLWTYDPNWDSVPVIYAYEMYKNREGEWETSNDWSFSYPYTQEDIDWVVDKFTLTAGIADLGVDEWFTSNDINLVQLNLSPNARDFVSKLPHYQYQDLREQENA
jgi:hypothetical protein